MLIWFAVYFCSFQCHSFCHPICRQPVPNYIFAQWCTQSMRTPWEMHNPQRHYQHVLCPYHCHPLIALDYPSYIYTFVDRWDALNSFRNYIWRAQFETCLNSLQRNEEKKMVAFNLLWKMSTLRRLSSHQIAPDIQSLQCHNLANLPHSISSTIYFR